MCVFFFYRHQATGEDLIINKSGQAATSDGGKQQTFSLTQSPSLQMSSKQQGQSSSSSKVSKTSFFVLKIFRYKCVCLFSKIDLRKKSFFEFVVCLFSFKHTHKHTKGS